MIQPSLRDGRNPKPLLPTSARCGMEARLPKSFRDFQPEVARALSTATRLCNEAQGWTEGTTLGVGCGRASTPTGLWPEGITGDWFSGRRAATPLGLTGIAAQITQGWRGANPGLCYTTPLGLELPAAFQPILSLMDKALAQPANSRTALAFRRQGGRSKKSVLLRG